MALSIVSSNTSTYSGASVTITASWTPQEDDLIILYLSCTNTFSLTPPSDWVDCGVGDVDPGDSSTSSQALIHLVTASEASTSTTSWTISNLFSGGGSEAGRWWMVVVRGADPTDPIDGVGSWMTADLLSTHQLASIAGSSLEDGSLVVRFVSTDLTSRIYTAPTGHTELYNGDSNTGGWVGYRDALTTAGVDVSEQAIVLGTGSDEGVAISIAV